LLGVGWPGVRGESRFGPAEGSAPNLAASQGGDLGRITLSH
jgi:hypothetical protein